MSRIDTLVGRLMFLKTCILNTKLDMKYRRKALNLYVINLREAVGLNPDLNHKAITKGLYD
jgi:hypothetical protein